VTYHASLRQFLNASIAPAKANPARAAKARDKLLRLSPSQFFELSTDVYDELQRRIDESSEEKGFLLPKSSFHPKRNEAREKLGLLQQTRFRDLVSDIQYEIERRNYHTPRQIKRTVDHTPPVAGLGISQTEKKDSSTKISEKGMTDLGGVASVQQSTVIPTEANLAWSSDEDEDQVSQTPNRKLSQDKKPNGNAERISEVKVLQHAKVGSITSIGSVSSSKKRTSNQSDRDYVAELTNSIKNKTQSGASVARGLSVSKGRNKDREIELLLEEGTKMDKTITELEQRTSLLQSKSDKLEKETQDLLRINGDLKDQVFNLEKEVEQKNDKIKALYEEINSSSSSRTGEPAVTSDSFDVNALKKENEELRYELEKFRTSKVEEILGLGSISDDHQQFDKLLSRNGLVPLPLLLNFRELVQSFLVGLGKYSKTKEVDSNDIFDQISRISNISTDIANCASNTENAELIRASISHAITATRYYAIYGNSLPQLVIESAISEVVFTVYDFIQDAKLKNTDSTAFTDPIQKEVNVTQSGHSFNSGRKGTPSFRPSELEQDNELNDSHVSPVKPLRMAKRGDNSYKAQDANLTINSELANSFQKKVIDSPDFSKPGSRCVSPLVKSTGLASLVSRYSPDNFKKIHTEPRSTTSPSKDESPSLKKSSSSNILSKVRQFEHQSDQTFGSKTPSPVSKKSFFSPSQDSKVDQFGKGRSSLEVLEKPIDQPDLREVKKDEEHEFDGANGTDEYEKSKLDGFSSDIAQEESEIKKDLPESVHLPVGSRNTTKTSYEQPIEVNEDSEDESLGDFDVTSLRKAIVKDTKSNPLENLKDVTSSVLTKDFSSDDKLQRIGTNGVTRDLNDLPDVPQIRSTTTDATFSGDSFPQSREEVDSQKDNFKDREVLTSNQSGDFKSNGAPVSNGTNSVSKGPSEVRNVAEEGYDDEDDLNEEVSNHYPAIESRQEKGLPSRVISEESSTGQDYVQPQEEYSDEESEEEFDIDEFVIDNPDNTLSELLLYLEHQTVKVISTIQALLTSIKTADSTNGELRSGSKAINDVVGQMVEATSVSMNQSRNAQLKEHGSWVVDTLANAGRRMKDLTQIDQDNRAEDDDYADKHFKQRLAGIAFDVAKCTKELVKTVEEANLKEEIEHLNKKLIK
jgi:hypothetical protein